MTSLLLLRYLGAAAPIILLLVLMIFPRWGAHRAGPAAWLSGILIAALLFGLTPEVFWMSQARGILLTLYVLAVLWPALWLYHLIQRFNGINALSQGLQALIANRTLLIVTIAWAFSSLLEGLAGFGLPIAIVSPMLIGLNVSPVAAIAAVAIGHAWSVTFGDVGVVFQTLTNVTQLDEHLLAGPSAALTGVACLLCGAAVLHLLAPSDRWKMLPRVMAVGIAMVFTQYALVVGGLAPLGAFGAGVAGVLAAVFLSRHTINSRAALRQPIFIATVSVYGALSLLMTTIAWPGPVNAALRSVVWAAHFEAVTTTQGWMTPAGTGQVFRPLVHPGMALLAVVLLGYFFLRRAKLCMSGDLIAAARSTAAGTTKSSVGILATVCLSTLMEHTGMTQLMAQGLAGVLGATFPIVSPFVGILGAFATGSNNNSNVLFGPLQKSVALLLQIDPRWLLAAQTAGGGLGSMIAPAKLTLGCATVGLPGSEGDVLRHTLGVALAIGTILGILALIGSMLQ